MILVVHLAVGPRDHGVVRFAGRLGDLMNAPVLHVERAEYVDLALAHRLSAAGGVHLQYTDALYAPHTTEAAETFVRLRHGLAAPVSVTLHDLPDPGDELSRYRRRAASYARVARSVDAVVVNSIHELSLLEHVLAGGDPGPAPRVRVVTLPIETPQIVGPDHRPEPLPEVAVFGFVYPGKGHADVIEASAGLPPEVSFTALGRIADGHDDLGHLLAAVARRNRRRLQITGLVPDDGLVQRLQRVAVPVVPALRISASGSINTWIAAGRRPLVADGSYTREIDQRYPGALHLYRPAELPGLIRAVLADPGLSWLQTPVPEDLTGAAVARAYTELITDAWLRC